MVRTDSLSRTLEQKLGAKWLVDLRNNYENKQLKALVLDETNTVKIIETDRKIIQKFEPCFMKPASRYGRAHFYAPVKRLGNMDINTFRFNTAVIWLVSLLFYIALYFKLLQKVINWLGNFRAKRSPLDRISFIIEPPA